LPITSPTSLQKRKSSPNILAGAYGNPKTGQISLPATIAEVSTISNIFPNTINLVESAFSFSATEAQTSKHNILHLATHAEFNGNPNTSFIYFGNGDTVSLSNIKDWKMSNIDLIVLSACQTGSGKLGNGIEILGFGYQVQLAGAKASIASLWKVSDEGTQVLMKSFYENIKQGDLPTSESLRQAQIATIRSQQFSHPYYWSAFILIGSGL
jgi:CHAT domain-containing protein